MLYVFLCVFVVGLGLEKIAKLIEDRYLDAPKGLMFAAETDTAVVKVDEDTVWCLELLIINLVYCVLGNSFAYDPSRIFSWQLGS